MRTLSIISLIGFIFISSKLLVGQSEPGKHQTPKDYPVTWSADLKLKQLTDIPARLKHPFSKEELDGLRDIMTGYIFPYRISVPRNCEDLLDKTDRLMGTRGSDSMRTDEWGTLGGDCATLRALRSAVPAKHSFVRDLPWTAALFSLLPVASEWNDQPEDQELQAAKKKGLSIREFQPHGKFSMKFNNLLQVQDDDRDTNAPWGAAYMKYASGDFDGDGFDDILIRTDGGSGGARVRSFLYLVTRKDPDKNAKLIFLRKLY